MAGIVHILKRIDGSSDSKSIYKILKADGIALDSDLLIKQQSGELRFHKEVRFARRELVEAGLVRKGEDGVWALSRAGKRSGLTPVLARNLITQRRHRSRLENGLRKHIQKALHEISTGPVPVAWLREVARQLDGPTYTYLLRFGKTDVWKVGFAKDIAKRVNDVNKHIPSEIIAESWACIARHRWSDVLAAYSVEQQILNRLGPLRTIGERAKGSRVEVLNVWKAVVHENRDIRRHPRSRV